MSFHTSLSGLNAASTKLATTSNNIANAATDTFKRSNVEFADIYSQNVRLAPGNSVGQGVTTASISQQFTQGSISKTDRALDIAISGNGFFAIQPTSTLANGQIYYSRGGSFNINETNNVINSSGDRLLAINTSGATGPLTIPPSTKGEFITTKKITQNLILPASADPPKLAFDRNNLSTYNASNNFSFYDSEGKLKSGTIYYIKEDSNPSSKLSSWNTKLFVGSTEVPAKAVEKPVAVSDTAIMQKDPMGFTWSAIGQGLSINNSPFNINSREFSVINNEIFEKTLRGDIKVGSLTTTENSISLEFIEKTKDSEGNYTDSEGLTAQDIYDFLSESSFDEVIDYKRSISPDGRIWLDESGRIINGFEKPTYDIPGTGVIEINRLNTRSSSGNFNLVSQVIDGRPEGDLTGINIDANGNVVGTYSNGSNNLIGQLQITTFANPEGLRQIGDTRYIATAAAGDSKTGVAGTDGFGLVQSGAVERSNVDLTTELVDLIMAQRNFQANSKAIEIDNTMTKSIIDSVRS